jgi:AcrR family transcriptional regulator
MVSDDPRENILALTLKLVGEQGIAGTSMADIGSAVGVSRATLYRYFPGGKDEVMESMVRWEQTQYLGRIRDAIEGSPDLVTLLQRALRVGRREIEAHVQLQRVLATEPERFFALFLRGDQRILKLVASYLAPLIAATPHPSSLDIGWAADEIARSFLSLVDGNSVWDLDDPDVDRMVAERYLLACLRAQSGQPGVPPTS